jgi:hypothetical protein
MLKDSLLKFASVTLLILLCAISAPPAATAPKEKSGSLKFYLQIKKADFKLGEPVEVLIALKNSGKIPLWVNSRLLVNYATHPHEVYFKITGPTEVIPFKLKIRAGEPTEQDFVLLAPGQIIFKNLNLEKAFALEKGGTYKVQAFYENQKSLAHKKVWQGKLSSNTLSFTLKELK